MMRSRALLAILPLPIAISTSLPAQRAAADTAWALAAPVTYAGDLPCADCAAIHRTLTLRPDGTYLSRDVYRGAAGDTAQMVEMGRWSVTGDARRISLRGGETPVWFGVRGAATLRMLDESGNEIASRQQYDLARTPSPDTASPPLALLGAFAATADAATFTDCASGMQLAVAREGDWASLERAYQQASSSPGTPVAVRVEGRITRGAEGENGPSNLLVVDRFAEVQPNARCAATDGAARLEEGTWTLTSVGGMAPEAGSPAPTLTLDPGEHAASGFAGCNQFFGRYVRRGSDLRFADLGATRMACAATMMLETRYMAALNATTRFEASGDTLTLFAGGRAVATFGRM
ncbi:META domain-containing protein [Longimicrobium sp.]|uniref:META domain-containing protein n=1 Tax=Longimicrobium sp. TaxID=2029185 RepID=UPI002B574164|nr:META domain-containing protein [Longimicrobium sp.]HSU13084.1 META domain-containing protein [Longimicrobium sp.]